MSPMPGRSTLMTSAPNQARSCVQVGPDCTCVKSRMRTPWSALPSMPNALFDGLGRLLPETFATALATAFLALFTALATTVLRAGFFAADFFAGFLVDFLAVFFDFLAITGPPLFRSRVPGAAQHLSEAKWCATEPGPG